MKTVNKVQISVIIPTYNRANLLPRALDSVLTQTHKADEIIVIDDGSTDSTAEVVKQYPNVILLQQQNLGVSAARNHGIKKSKTDWIALLDSDDEWLSNKLESQIKAVSENPDYKLIHSDEIWIRNGVRVNAMNKHKKYGGDIFQHCLPLCCISPSSSLIHKSLFDEVGLFDESLPACEDYDLWLRICCRYPVYFLEDKLIIKHGGHEDQLSQAHWGMDRFRIQALEKCLASGQLNEQQTQQTIDMLTKKLKIFLNGAKKRNNSDYTEQYTALLNKYLTSDTTLAKAEP